MKTLRSILGMILFLSMCAPCVHGEGHDNHEEEGIALSGVACRSGCHELPTVHCSKPHEALTFLAAPLVTLPKLVRPFRLPTCRQKVSFAAPRRSLNLQFLQTVQFLI